MNLFLNTVYCTSVRCEKQLHGFIFFFCKWRSHIFSAKNDFVQLVHFLFCILLIQPHFRHTHYFSLPLSRRSVRQKKKSNQRKNISCLCVDLRPSTSIPLSDGENWNNAAETVIVRKCTDNSILSVFVFSLWRYTWGIPQF